MGRSQDKWFPHKEPLSNISIIFPTEINHCRSCQYVNMPCNWFLRQKSVYFNAILHAMDTSHNIPFHSRAEYSEMTLTLNSYSILIQNIRFVEVSTELERHKLDFFQRSSLFTFGAKMANNLVFSRRRREVRREPNNGFF